MEDESTAVGSSESYKARLAALGAENCLEGMTFNSSQASSDIRALEGVARKRKQPSDDNGSETSSKRRKTTPNERECALILLSIAAIHEMLGDSVKSFSVSQEPEAAPADKSIFASDSSSGNKTRHDKKKSGVAVALEETPTDIVLGDQLTVASGPTKSVFFGNDDDDIMDDFEPLPNVMALGSEMDIDPSVASQIVEVNVSAYGKPKEMTMSEVLKMMQSETTTTIHQLDFTKTLMNDGQVDPIVLVLKQASKTNTLIGLIRHGSSMSIIDRAKYSSYIVGNDGATALAKALETNPPLLSLDLASNSIGVEGAKALAKALETYTMLQKLDLGYNEIGDEGAKVLAKALETHTSLQDLDLGDNSIGDEGAKALANALETNKTLQHLKLGDNSIGDEGAKALANALETNKTLQHLKLGGKKIGVEGSKALVMALSMNTTLQKLDLSGCSFGAKGAKAFAEVLETNETLQEFYLGHNSIGDDGAKAFAKVLGTNATLQHLGLGDNSIGDEGATTLASALETNTTLQKLDLSFNSIGDEGAKALANALETNMTLQELNLSFNSIGDEGAMALLMAIRNHNGTLFDINLLQVNKDISDYLTEEIESLVKQNKNSTRNPRPMPRLPAPSSSNDLLSGHTTHAIDDSSPNTLFSRESSGAIWSPETNHASDMHETTPALSNQVGNDSDSKAESSLSDTSTEQDTAESSKPRKRGRPKGSKNKKKRKSYVCKRCEENGCPNASTCYGRINRVRGAKSCLCKNCNPPLSN